MGNVEAFAQTTFKANIDNTTVAIGDRLLIHYSLVLNEGGDVKPISLPNFTGFQMVGRKPARNISVINGDIQNEFMETIYLVAQREGDFTIPGAKVVVNGRQMTSNSITVTVIEGKQRSSSTARVQGEEVFLDLQLSEEVVFPNQPLYAVVKLYAKSYDALRRRSDLEVPRLSNFQVYRLDERSSARNYQQEVINGEVFLSEEVAKFQLFPQQSGVLEIQPFQLRVAIPLSFFDEKLVSLRTKSKWVDVKALPAKMPSGYQGAIGNFALKTNTTSTQLQVGESLEITYVISGNGNFSEINALKIPAQSGLELYPVKTVNQFQQSSQSQAGSKTFKYLIVPQKEGNYQIQPVHFHFLNPENSNYNTLSTDLISFRVVSPDSNPAPSQDIAYTDTILSDNTGSTIQKYIPKQIERIFESGSSSNTGTDLRNTESGSDGISPWWWSLAAIPLALLLYFLARKKGDQTEQAVRTPTVMRNKENLDQKLQNLRTNVRQNDLEGFLQASSELLNEIVVYVNNQRSIYTVEQSRKLLIANISESYASRWEQEINKTQLMRYSSATNPVDLESSYNQHQELIKELLTKKLK